MLSVNMPLGNGSEVDRSFFFDVRSLCRQGRPLTVEEHEHHAVIRQASWGEMLRHTFSPGHWNQQTERITELFTKAVETQRSDSPKKNQESWMMHSAWLWKSNIKKAKINSDVKQRFAKVFNAARMGLSAEDYDKLPEDFLKGFYNKYYQYHLQSFFDQRLRVTGEGKVELPFEQGGRTVYKKWENVKNIFKPNKMGELGSHRFGPRGYIKGSWPNGHCDDPTTFKWDPYIKEDPANWGRKYVLEIVFWCDPTEDPGTSQAHYYWRLRHKNGNVRSAGRYRERDWTPQKGARCSPARIESPDESDIFWSERNYMVQNFRFEIDRQKHDDIINRLEERVHQGRLWYRAPDHICDEDYSYLLDMDFDFSMRMTTVMWNSYVKQPLSKAGSWMPHALQNGYSYLKEKLSFSLPDVVTDGAERVARAVETPIVNILAMMRGGMQLAPECAEWATDGNDGTEARPEPTITAPSGIMDTPRFVKQFFTEQHFASHPHRGYTMFQQACEGYSQDKGLGAHDPDRVYPLELLQSLTQN